MKKFKNLIRQPKVYRALLGVLALYIVWLYIFGVIVGLISTGVKGQEMSYGITSVFGSLFESNLIGLASYIFFGIIVIALFYNWRKKDLAHEGDSDKRGFKYSTTGEHGTSQFQKDEEIMENFTTTKRLDRLGQDSGLILGSLESSGEAIVYPWNARLNHNVIIFGAPSTGKTTCFMYNQLLQSFVELQNGFKSSSIIIDTKGEIYEEYGGLARKMGFKTRILNLVEFENSDGCQFLNLVYNRQKKKVDEAMVTTFVKIVISNTRDENSKNPDEYFESQLENLLEAVILIEFYKFEDGLQDMPTLASVVDVIDNLLVASFRGEYTTIAESYAIGDGTHKSRGKGNAGTRHWRKYINVSKQIENTPATLSNRLSVIQAESVKEMLSHDDIDFDEPATEPCMYFLRISDQNKTYKFISALFLTFLFIRLTAIADANNNPNNKGRTECKVKFLLDEFCSAGIIPDIKEKFSTLRGRNIDIWAIIQSMPLFNSTYGPDTALAILGNCAIRLLLGTDEPETKKWASNELDTTTIVDEGKRTEAGAYKGALATYGTKERDLMTEGEIGSMPYDEEIIFIDTMNPIKCKKFFYKNHPIAKLLEDETLHERATEHIPHYKQFSREYTNIATNNVTSYFTNADKSSNFDDENDDYDKATAPTTTPNKKASRFGGLK